MSEILVCNDTTMKCLEFFYENISHFGKVIKLISFFDNENFLFTSYNVDNESIHTIIVNEKGDEIHLASLNCGYGGTGPSGTAEVLKYMGISKEEAEKQKLYRSL